MSLSKVGMKICNPDETSKIVYSRIKIVFDTAIGDEEPTKFYDTVFDYIEITPEIKSKIWVAIGEAESEARKSPFTILVPKKLITRKRIPYEENPIPFADHVMYLIPYINKIMVLEKWDERDNE